MPKRKSRDGDKVYWERKKSSKKVRKEVLRVLNSVAETKHYAFDQGIANISGWASYNVSLGLVKGTGSNQRIGDKVYMKGMRLSYWLGNNNTAPASDGESVTWRVVVFLAKGDFNLSSIPNTTVFEGDGAGSTPANYINAPMDTNQVIPLYDKVHVMTPQYDGQYVKVHRLVSRKLNRSFYYNNDDGYGKTYNLYVGFVNSSFGIPTNPALAGFNCRIGFSDI